MADVGGATPLIALDAVVIDSETTSLDPAKARIVEIAAVRLVAGRVDTAHAFGVSSICCSRNKPRTWSAGGHLRMRSLSGVCRRGTGIGCAPRSKRSDISKTSCAVSCSRPR